MINSFNVTWLIIIIFITIFITYFIAYKKGKNDEVANNKVNQKLFQNKSRAVLGGKISEQIAPFLSGFLKEGLKASEARFIGSPIDFLVFKGMDKKEIEEVIFVEIKSGKSQLSTNERKLRDVINAGKVRWCECRIDEEITKESNEQNSNN